MSIVNLLDQIRDWTQETICNPVSFKVPPIAEEIKKASIDSYISSEEENLNDGENYEYSRATPKAFIWLLPNRSRLPENISSVPSVIIRLGEGTVNIGKGTIPIEMDFVVWNPGTHGSDIIYQIDDKSYIQWSGEEAKSYFERNNEGWRDVWNWIDLAVKKIESTESIGGIKIDKSTLKFGPMKNEDGIPDFYPFWLAYISFDVKTYTHRIANAYDKFL